MTPQNPLTTGRTIILAGLLVLLTAFFVLLGIGLMSNEPVTGNSGITRVGKPAPDFSFETLDGNSFRLSEHFGQPIVVNFWSTWCPPCRDEAQILEHAWRKYDSQTVIFVGVDIQEDATTGLTDARTFLSQFDITYINGMDDDGSITIDYGVIGLPVTFFIDSKGIVVQRWVGAITSTQLQTSIEQLILGKPDFQESNSENLDKFYEFGERN